MMQRFWSVLAVTLGKRAGLVSVIGLLITLVLGFGITQLEFATGQDSYLNKATRSTRTTSPTRTSSAARRCSRVITMDEGHTVDELFTPENRGQLTQFHDDLLADRTTVHGVITPLTIAEFARHARAERQTATRPTSIAGKARCRPRSTKEQPGSPEQAARVDGRRHDARSASTRSRPTSGRSTTPSG